MKDKTTPIFECNSECQCSLETCQNRVSQKDDQSNHVQLISTTGKGFGVTIQQALPHPGTYVGEYIGEILTDIGARDRMKMNENAEHNYLLLYNEHHGETTMKTFVDARYYGNWTRFINHSCDPNLHIVPIRIDRFTPPHLAFFTLRSIEINEELSYSYGTMIDPIKSKACHCSSSICTAFLPYQQSD